MSAGKQHRGEIESKIKTLTGIISECSPMGVHANWKHGHINEMPCPSVESSESSDSPCIVYHFHDGQDGRLLREAGCREFLLVIKCGKKKKWIDGWGNYTLRKQRILTAVWIKNRFKSPNVKKKKSVGHLRNIDAALWGLASSVNDRFLVTCDSHRPPNLKTHSIPKSECSVVLKHGPRQCLLSSRQQMPEQ